jgi:hypothetical protein
MHQWISVAGILCIALSGWANPAPRIKFIQNQGQWCFDYDYTARVQGQSIFLGPGGASYWLTDRLAEEEYHHRLRYRNPETQIRSGEFSKLRNHLVTTEWIGSNPQARPFPFQELSEYANYFLGNDKSRWRSKVPLFSGVTYQQVYPGIDVQFYSQGEYVKYDWMVSPGADVSQIQIRYKGQDHLKLINGDLIVHTSLGEIVEKKPLAYQWIAGVKKIIPCAYTVEKDLVRFTFPDGYDPCHLLVIDPLLIFSTYSGSTADNWGSTATPGERGTLYSSGITIHGSTRRFPATPGAFQTTYGGDFDVSILKYDSTGSQLLYASYLGGAGPESSHSLVVNSNGELFVLGTTGSEDFPIISGAFDNKFDGGIREVNVFEYPNGADIFISKVSQDGTQLLASTFLGGSKNDGMNPSSSSLVANYGDQLRGDILAPISGDVYISTVTSSDDFPVVNGFDNVYNGGLTDALVIRMSDDLSTMRWASFLGGSLADASHTIKVDRQGDVYVGGGTSSSNFPVTPGSYQVTFGGEVDGWIAQIKGDGSGMVKATLTGTPVFDQVYFIDLDSSDHVFAYGQTEGSFPVTTGTFRNANSGQFLQKFNPEMSTLIFSTVFGSGIGIPNISPTAFLVNDCNNIYLSGWGGALNRASGFWNSSTAGMPVTSDAFQKTTSGSDFYFMVLTADASQLLYATFLGGTQSRTHVDGGTSRFDKGGIVYHAVCSGCSPLNATGRSTSDFPTTPGAWSRVNRSANCNNAAFKFDLSSLRARLQTNSLTLTDPGLNRLCIPDPIVFQNFSTGGRIYRWSFGDGGTRTTNTRDTIVYHYRTEGLFTVKLLAIDEGTCLVKDSATTTVHVFQKKGIAEPGPEVCVGLEAQLQASGGVQYSWQQENSDFRSGISNPKVTVSDTTRFFVQVTDVNGCVLEDTVTVKVVPRQGLSFDFEPAYDCDGRTQLLVRNRHPNQINDENFFFDFGDGSVQTGTDILHSFPQDGTYPVRLVQINEFCQFDTTAVVAIATLKIPNVFTPEQSPGFNDTFVIEYGGRSISETQVKTSLSIVNRWGKKIFESENYQNNWRAESQPAGVYYFEARFEDDTRCKGWVQVIK